MATEITNGKITHVLIGAPDWMTPDLIRYTITTWQPYYTKPLTPADAVEMLRNVGNLYQLLLK